MATFKAINCLSTAELSVLLSVFHLDVTGRLTAQENLGILKYHSGYTAPFRPGTRNFFQRKQRESSPQVRESLFGRWKG